MSARRKRKSGQAQATAPHDSQILGGSVSTSRRLIAEGRLKRILGRSWRRGWRWWAAALVLFATRVDEINISVSDISFRILM